MGESDYSVKINRQEGIVEIAAPDKEWITEQLDKLADVFVSRREDAPPPAVRKRQSSVGTDGTEKQSKTSGPATTTRARGGGRKPKVDEELRQQLTAEVRKKLEAFRAEREPNFESRQDQAAIIATFLQDELGLDGIDPRQLYTVYSIMGWPAPADTRSLIKDARRRSGYFSGGVDGRAPLSSKGENFGRHHSKEPKES